IGLVDAFQGDPCGQPRSLSSRPARRASPPAGGLHCTWTTRVPWAASVLANISRPTLTTRGAAASRPCDLASRAAMAATLHHRRDLPRRGFGADSGEPASTSEDFNTLIVHAVRALTEQIGALTLEIDAPQQRTGTKPVAPVFWPGLWKKHGEHDEN